MVKKIASINELKEELDQADRDDKVVVIGFIKTKPIPDSDSNLHIFALHLNWFDRIASMVCEEPRSNTLFLIMDFDLCNEEIMEEFNISSVPTFVVSKNKKLLTRLTEHGFNFCFQTLSF